MDGKAAAGSDALPLVLVVDDDRALTPVIVEHFEASDLRCAAAHDGDTALAIAFAQRPALVLLDVGLPDMTGDEVFARLKADQRTRYTPILFLTGASRRVDKVRRLLEGADDYVTKPFDIEELAARVHAAIRRARLLGGLNPISGLPGNAAIYDEMTARLRRGERFACLYLDLDHFKSFNDRYGFTRGDTLIGALADAIFGAAAAVAPDAFLGHVGGDDFIILSGVDEAERLAGEIVSRFAQRSQQLHDSGDRAAGGYEAPDRKGMRKRWPLVSVSVGIAIGDPETSSSAAALAQTAAEVKGVAKRQASRRVAVDRRLSGIRVIA